jgi:hypothetical protein
MLWFALKGERPLEGAWDDLPEGFREGAGDDPAQRKHATVGHLAAYAIQQTMGRDFGFKSFLESKDDMPQIKQRIREVFEAENIPRGIYIGY